MASGSPEPTCPTMPREPTWPATVQGPQFPPCPGNQNGHLADPYPQLPPCLGNQHGQRQPQADNSRHSLGTNMATSSARPTVPATTCEAIWTPGSPRTTAPAMPQEPTWPPGSPGPTAAEMLLEPTWPAAVPGPQLLPWPWNQHDRLAAADHSSCHALGTNMTARQPWDHRSSHSLGTNMAGKSPGPTAAAMRQDPKWLLPAPGQ